MKTAFTSSNKDNVATTAILAVTLFIIASGLFASAPAAANHAAEANVQIMDAIVVTAPRTAHITLDPIIVTASRNHE